MKKINLNNSQKPLHFQIADYLLFMLETGDLKQNEKLPTEEALTGMFSVSRTTIRKSLGHLLNRSLIHKKQGSGTYWTDSSYSLKIEKMSGINRQIFAVTDDTTVKFLSKKKVKPEGIVTEFLGLSDRSPVIEFRRLRFTGKQPTSYTINYLPLEIGEKINKEHIEQNTMLETLEKVLNIKLGTIQHEVEITRADPVIADHLKIVLLNPVLTITTSVFDTGKRPVEIVWTYFVEDRYKFRVILENENAK